METIIDNPDLKENRIFFYQRCHVQAVFKLSIKRYFGFNKLDEANETFAKEPIILNEIIEGSNDVALEIEQKKSN